MIRHKQNDFYQDLGLRIMRRRQMQGLTQEQLARHLGVSPQMVQKYENALHKIAPERLLLCAQALGVPISHLYGEADVDDVRAISRLTGMITADVMRMPPKLQVAMARMIRQTTRSLHEASNDNRPEMPGAPLDD